MTAPNMSVSLRKTIIADHDKRGRGHLVDHHTALLPADIEEEARLDRVAKVIAEIENA